MALKRTIRKKAKQQAELQRQQNAPDNRMNLSKLQLEMLKNGDDTNTKPVSDIQNNTVADKLISNYTPVIDERVVAEAAQRLKKYRSHKNHLEQRIKANEDYWKLRQWGYIDNKSNKNNQNDSQFKVATPWLWNCITSKHADLMDGYPISNIRPKREDDIEEADKLKSILPVIYEENDYESTYSNICNYLLKHGGCVVGIYWDGKKHDGLGDISIEKVDILELFWESGITDLQDSREIFHTKYEDNDRLTALYPQLQGKLGGKDLTVTEYQYDDSIDNTNKSIVVDWYYKKTDSTGNQVVHYCKFVNGTVLFASENEPDEYPNGWYDHGKYPYVTASLFDIEGSLFGYGYTDIGRGDQNAIDVITSAILKNAVVTAKPRFFKRINGGVSEAEFADWNKDFIHVQGNIDEEAIRQITTAGLPNFVVDMRDRFINEMKETLGNRDVSNGGSTSGITAASAIATMQEQSGKISRTHNKTMYVMHRQITNMVIELIRQFYDIPREYRITGSMGKDIFVKYDNSGLKPQKQPSILGMEMGLRLPCFDIEVSAEKQSPYSKMEQNELAMQLYNLGVFSPQNVDMALALLRTMDFDHKDEIMQMVSSNGTMLQKYQQLQQVAFMLAQQVDMQNGTQMAEQLAQAILAENGQNPADIQTIDGSSDVSLDNGGNTIVDNARAKARQATQVQ